MEQQTIRYKDIIDLGAKETFGDDKVFFDTYGYKYSVVEIKLKKRVFVEWSKSTRKARLIKVDAFGIIKDSKPICNYEELKELVRFFR